MRYSVLGQGPWRSPLLDLLLLLPHFQHLPEIYALHQIFLGKWPLIQILPACMIDIHIACIGLHYCWYFAYSMDPMGFHNGFPKRNRVFATLTTADSLCCLISSTLPTLKYCNMKLDSFGAWLSTFNISLVYDLIASVHAKVALFGRLGTYLTFLSNILAECPYFHCCLWYRIHKKHETEPLCVNITSALLLVVSLPVAHQLSSWLAMSPSLSFLSSVLIDWPSQT